ncbi:hypothetical protein JCM8097_002672 [Rhodosporidiobolus ruineniae]
MAVHQGLFGGTHTANDGKQAVFVQLKSITVPLLEASRAAPTASTVHTTTLLLDQLRSVLLNTPTTAFTPALANYVFFPLSSLLQPRTDGRDRGDRVLEAAMLALAALVDKWRASGMEHRIRQELWIMVALTLGGPLNPNRPQGAGVDKGKGRAVERTDETKLAMVEVLVALMKADEGEREELREEGHEDDDPLGERIDWSASDPASASSLPKTPPFTPPPVPILFHTLTTLLSLAAEPTSLLQLQLSSLSVLQVLLFDYLAHPAPSPLVLTVEPGAGPSALLATALPGTASTLSRIALSKPRSVEEAETSTRKQASPVVVLALQTLAKLVVATTGNEVTAKLRSSNGSDETGLTGSATLEELVEAKLSEIELAEADEEETDADAPPQPPNPPPSAPTGPTVPTPAWLRFTLSSLSTLFAALSPLTTHSSALVRTALVDLLASVVEKCPTTLGEHLSTPLEGLLALASDSWPDVSAPARTALLAAFACSPAVLALAAGIVQRRLAALPRALRRKDEHAAQRGAGIVRVALELLPAVSSSASGGGGGSVLHGVEKWSWAFLSAVELERIPGAGRAGEGSARMALAWITGSAGEGASAGQATAFPPIRLRGVEEDATVSSLEALWRALGTAAAAAGQEGEVVDLFLGTALGPRRGKTVAASALWVLEGVLKGVEAGKVGKVQRKVLRRAVKAVLGLLEELEVKEEADEPVPPTPSMSSRTDLLVVDEDGDSPMTGLIEHKKGVTTAPSFDKYNPAVALSSSRDSRASHSLLLTSLSLRLLSTLASLLSTAFQPFLMQALYHVLAHTSPTTHPYLRETAAHALSLFSDALSFASPQNLVLSNVDYVVNSVSQRLSPSRLEPQAPLVLVEMIRLVGRPIVPMVQDLVDDVFEALDDYHGYEEVTVGLWAVLDALLKVMEEELPPMEERMKASGTKDVVVPKPEDDWKAFEEWFARRNEAVGEEDEDIEEINPQQPFSSSATPDPADASLDPSDPSEPSFDPTASSANDLEPDPAPLPPTRPQLITAQILSKALYFLSHPSPFLRARVLSLFASAVPLLARPSLDLPASSSSAPPGAADPSAHPEAARKGDLLPVVHRAWPIILLRLSPSTESSPFVVLAAVELVERLAVHVGDFLSRRVVDDVWPRFRSLLVKQEDEEKKDRAAGQARGERYSASARMYRSILCTLEACARAVPLKEAVVWEQAVLLRRFLLPVFEREVQELAVRVYEALGEVNADAVWVVLEGTRRGGEEGLPGWLRMREFEVEGAGRNVVRVLDGL